MSNKVHSQRNIPFSWENKPGISKAVGPQDDNCFAPQKLPLPPCPSENYNSRVSFHDIQIPLPPCTFQQTSRSTSRKGLKKMDDPFLIAYKEVTKSNTKGRSLVYNYGNLDRLGFGFKKNMSIFSCKQSSCIVMEDSIVRLSQIPISKSQRGGGNN